ncbi:hypothetical protein ADU80_06260 [Clostridium botulinum]|uniref:DUF998 domain-containing protein n=4 Tax=Clostridium botulinum TaxID=1491 RepID=A0A9Q1ZCA4_CLOBO|nr:DUF998 domain-containing protein [Clostridium botulinum]KEI01365.1 hypothetical protein Y848_09550 [Clostridium botulinum C/D str. Sp77]KLU77021.1 hypothetical protein CBC3_00550 [Clostridium botulinum V891]MCD3198415.1 DUF998 domain-containing protein [Clostridium botulinum C/D]KEI00540.1 hypothetical protein Z953_10030 [Clostridium botulinum D str. 16868]KOA77049.1 hypothetical protein ADU77_08160 [Clostridium botulinum]
MVFILIVMIIDLLIPFLIAIPYKGYSHSKMVMSILGCKASPLGEIYNIWLILSGCVVTLLGYSIFCAYNKIYYILSLMIFIFLALYGIGDEIISSFFPLNEKKEDITFSSQIHCIGSGIGFTSMQFAPLLLAILQFKTNKLILSICSGTFFILSFILFIFFIIAGNPQFKNTVFALKGLWQRVLCTLMYSPFLIWIIVSL